MLIKQYFSNVISTITEEPRSEIFHFLNEEDDKENTHPPTEPDLLNQRETGNRTVNVSI